MRRHILEGFLEFLQVELVQTAIGESPDHRIKKRSRNILLTFISKFLRYKYGKKFWLEDLLNNNK